MIDAIVSGTSIIVLRTEPPPRRGLTCLPDSATSQAADSRPRAPAIIAVYYDKAG
jgi:hypothetical protein